jgi:hypothetical protein
MAFRTESSLEELLAEPMVVVLMQRDGVPIGEARALYASVAQRLKENARNARPHVINRTARPPDCRREVGDA